MDLEFVYDGRRFQLHPDNVDAPLELPPFERHAAFHSACQQIYRAQKPDGPPPETELSAHGFTTQPGCLTREEAETVSDHITAVLEERGPEGSAYGPIDNDPDNISIAVPYAGKLLITLREALPKILNPRVEAMLESYYQCNFRIDVALTYRTHALERHTQSFLWHRDAAPMAQVHIMVYMTDSGPESGATMFLDLEQTRAAADLGYHFTMLDKRLYDLGDLNCHADRGLDAHCPELKAGDGVLFAAGRVLHRGSLPKKGYRDTFILVLQPSMVPWRQDIEEFGYGHIFVGHSKATLPTNPFKPLAPTISSEKQDLISMPDNWVIRGDLFPPSAS